MIMEYICKYPSATLSRYALFTAVDDETLMFTSVHPGFLQWCFCVLERFRILPEQYPVGHAAVAFWSENSLWIRSEVVKRVFLDLSPAHWFLLPYVRF